MKERITTVAQLQNLIVEEDQKMRYSMRPQFDPENFQQIYFRGERKEELVYLQQLTFKLNVGEIISDVASIDSSFLSQTAHIEKLVDDIATGIRPVSDLKYLKIHIGDLDISSCLRAIMLWQPYIQSRQEDDHLFLLTTLSAEEVTLLLNGTTIPFHNKLIFDGMPKYSPIKWTVLAKILSGAGHLCMDWDENNEYLKKCIMDYQANFKSMLHEFSRLQQHLTLYLNAPPDTREFRKKFLLNAGSSISMVPQSDASKIFSSSVPQKYSQVYAGINISDLVAMELNLLEKMHLEMRPCALCGKYFAPYSMRSIFCYRPNPKYNEKKCSVVGSLLIHRSKIKDSPLETLYKRRQKAYAKWVADHKNLSEQKIKDEIDDNFTKWKKSARNKLIAWRNDAITDDEFVASIALPPVRARSESLYELRQDIRAFKGNLPDIDM